LTILYSGHCAVVSNLGSWPNYCYIFLTFLFLSLLLYLEMD
jgi:hypothetical protein